MQDDQALAKEFQKLLFDIKRGKAGKDLRPEYQAFLEHEQRFTQLEVS